MAATVMAISSPGLAVPPAARAPAKEARSLLGHAGLFRHVQDLHGGEDALVDMVEETTRDRQNICIVGAKGCRSRHQVWHRRRQRRHRGSQDRKRGAFTVPSLSSRQRNIFLWCG